MPILEVETSLFGLVVDHVTLTLPKKNAIFKAFDEHFRVNEFVSL